MLYNATNIKSPEIHWYAVKAFYNRSEAMCERLKNEGVGIYTQRILPSYMFIQCTQERILEIKEKYWEKLFIFFDAERKHPRAIPEDEMANFILVTSNDFEGAIFLGEDKEEYHQGDRVRVIDGQFKGAEGYIKRIKKDRKLIVSINGIAALALAHIPSQLLEKVE